MKLIEPILFPIAPRPLEIMKIAGLHNIKSFDVLPNINPYYNHFDLVFNYIDPELLKNAVFELFDEDTPEEEIGLESFVNYWVDKIKQVNSPYSAYYRYFITTFLLIHPDYEKQHLTLKLWLDNIDLNFTFKKCFTFNKLTSPKRSYNTIIIPRLWTKAEKGVIPWINLLHDSTPRYFNQEKVVNHASEHLLDGGRIYVLRPQDFWKVMYSVGDDFDIEDAVLTKKTSPKTKTQTNNINWL